ncbi:MAG: siderophore-interacting protein [Gammaproteobacteria bacterium]|nr:siderophore-interacting protein [Gammaproteobacteria bacterium]
MNTQVSSRRVQRVRHELRRRDVQVAGLQSLGPGFRAITFRGEALGDFVSDSFDDHVKFMFTDASGEPVRRDYTPRRWDRERRELTIEFAMHGHGPASEWARQAVAGQRATVGGPRSSMIVPMDYDWHLLAGDGSALPAIHRRLEELPAATRAVVLLDMPDAADRRELASAAHLELHWAAGTGEWLSKLRALQLPAGAGYAWCAGEAAAMAAARRVLLDEKALPRADMRVAAYWKRGACGFHENLES